LLIWLKAQGQGEDSEALFLWFCLEWVGFCRGGVHLCACVIANCGRKAGSSCSCRHFGGIGVHEVPVWQWSECKGRQSAEVDKSGYLFLCKEGLVWVQAGWNVSRIERICRSSFLGDRVTIIQPFWVETWEDDNTYKHFIYVVSSSSFDFIYHKILIF